ncbi:MAG: hypothetical protein AB1480_09625 [Nitrospirota bacterium]
MTIFASSALAIFLSVESFGSPCVRPSILDIVEYGSTFLSMDKEGSAEHA